MEANVESLANNKSCVALKLIGYNHFPVISRIHRNLNHEPTTPEEKSFETYFILVVMYCLFIGSILGIIYGVYKFFKKLE